MPKNIVRQEYAKGYTEAQLKIECNANLPEKSKTSYKVMLNSYSSLIDRTIRELDETYL